METRTLLFFEDGRERSWEVTWEGPFAEVVESIDGVEAEVSKHVLSTPEIAAFVKKEIEARLLSGWIEREQAPKGPIAIDDHLEEMIRADPHAIEPHLVYADFLASNGDPRGELIAMHHAGMTEAAENLLRRHRDYFLGELANVIEALRIQWHLGFIRSVVIAPPLDAGDPARMTAVTLRRLLAHHSARFLSRLEIQRFEEHADYAETIEGMIELGFPPTLEELLIGRLNSNGAPVVSRMPNLGEALAKAPNAQRVSIRGGSFYQERSLDLYGVSLPNATRFELRTDHLQEETIEAMAEASWPRLEWLTLAGRTPVQPIAAMLEGINFPALSVLDLSGCELSNDDAQVILQSTAFRSLRQLLLPRMHGLLDESSDRLRSMRNVRFVDHVVQFDDAYDVVPALDEEMYEPDLYAYEDDAYWDEEEGLPDDVFDVMKAGYDDDDPW